jgi:O-antigen/teichoic acid export membrane protein
MIYRFTAAPILVYTAFVAVFGAPLAVWLFGAGYEPYGSVFTAAALYVPASYVGVVVAAALLARRRTAAVFAANLGGAALAVGVGWLLISFAGATGAIVGMTASGATTSAILVLFHLDAMRRDRTPVATQKLHEATA